MNGLLISAGMPLPEMLRTGPMDGGSFNLLAFIISLVVTGLLVIGTSKSAKVNAVLVAIKIVALIAFIGVAVPAVQDVNFEPFLPAGWGSPMGGIGVLGAAASIFFAYVGFGCGINGSRRNQKPQSQYSDWTDWLVSGVYRLLYARQLRCRRCGWLPTGAGCGWRSAASR